MSNAIDVSVVTVGWNSRKELAECLESLEQEFLHVRGEAIVVDNASNDGTVEMIQKRFPWVRTIANATNAGFAKANNQGAAIAKGDYILVLNPDTEVQPGAIQAMLDVFKRNEDAGVVGARLQYPDGSHQDSVRRFPTLLSHVLVLLKISTLVPTLGPLKRYYSKDFNYEQESTVDQVMGAAFLIPRNVFNDLGGFDESYWIWMEEVDLMKRVTQKGLNVLYTPNAIVKHHLGKSFGKTALMNRAKRFAVSSVKYFFKHHNPLSAFIVLLLAPVHLVLTFIYSLLPHD